MTKRERAEYFTQRWPAAAKANGWPVKNDEARRAVVLKCMKLVGGPKVTTSDARFGRDEVTALFCYLDHLAHPDCLKRSASWATCQDDYHTFNRARQADYHERELYGTGKNKWDRNRFKGAASAGGDPFDPTPDAKEVNKRHMNFAHRHQKKQRDERRAAKAAAKAAPTAAQPATAAVDPAANKVILLPTSVILLPWTETPAEGVLVGPDPAYVPPEGDEPF